MAPKHPAKFNEPLLSAIRPFIDPGDRILDPFAGVGTVHRFRQYPGVETWGVEIEREWAEQSPWTILGDSRFLPFNDRSFKGVVVSPTYANRVNDNFESKDNSRRITYRHYLGHKLHPANSGGMAWGKRYRDLHEQVWAECTRVLMPSEENGYFILNSKNHIRKGNEIDVTGWHCQVLEDLGFTEIHRTKVPTPGHREGRNYNVRLDYEYVIVFTSPNSDIQSNK
jgi:tRNA G10  N-methylase Trm11